MWKLSVLSLTKPKPLKKFTINQGLHACLHAWFFACLLACLNFCILACRADFLYVCMRACFLTSVLECIKCMIAWDMHNLSLDIHIFSTQKRTWTSDASTGVRITPTRLVRFRNVMMRGRCWLACLHSRSPAWLLAKLQCSLPFGNFKDETFQKDNYI